jgi:glycosyltransferase involved in cell wall biosynthesis
MSISLVVPAYNEAETIEDLFRLVTNFSNNCKDQVDLVIVENGSLDFTRAKLSSLSKIENPFLTRVIELDLNIGYGGAIKKGLAYSNSETIMLLPADGKYDLMALVECHQIYIEYGSSNLMIKGRRTLRNDPRSVQILSFAYTLLANILFRTSLKDINGLPKVFNSRLIRENIEILPNNACFDAGLIALWKRKGGHFYETPVRFNQQFLESTSWAGRKLKVSFVMFMELLRFSLNIRKETA